jgi:hypothetical protein
VPMANIVMAWSPRISSRSNPKPHIQKSRL